MSSQKEVTGVEIYSWKDLQGNKFRLNPKIEWLETPESVFCEDRVKGEKKGSHCKRSSKVVIYDKDYVACWLAQKVSCLSTDHELISSLLQRGNQLLKELNETNRN